MAGNGQRGSQPEGGYVPPQNLDAEISVLGAVMVAPNLIPAVTEVLRPTHFYREVTPEELYGIVSGHLGDLEAMIDELRAAAGRLARTDADAEAPESEE